VSGGGVGERGRVRCHGRRQRSASEKEERDVRCQDRREGSKRGEGQAFPASAGRVSRTAAASLDPPPRPAPMGFAWWSNGDLALTRMASRTRAAARGDQIIRYGERVIERDRSRRAGVKTKSSVSASRWLEDGAEFVETIGALEDTRSRLFCQRPTRTCLICRIGGARRRPNPASFWRPLRKVSSTAKAIPARRRGVADHLGGGSGSAPVAAGHR